MYRKEEQGGKKTVVMNGQPSGNVIHIEYQGIVLSSFREIHGLKRLVKTTLIEVLKRAKSDLLRDLAWTEVRNAPDLVQGDLDRLLSLSLVSELVDERVSLLEAERGVFSPALCLYLSRVYPAHCRLVEDSVSCRLLVLISYDDLAYVQVNKAEGSLQVKQLARRDHRQAASPIEDVVRRVYHWLWLRLVC